MSHFANQTGTSPGAAGWLVSRAWRTSQLCKLMALQSTPGVSPSPHAKFRRCAKCHTMLTSPIANSPSLARVATLQTNGTKALPGSVRVHMQSFGAAENLTLC